MKRDEKNQKTHKIDMILSGMETIGSAERSTDKEDMYYHFKHIVDGRYAQILYDRFRKTRIEKELYAFLAHDFFNRSGSRIGIIISFTQC